MTWWILKIIRIETTNATWSCKWKKVDAWSYFLREAYFLNYYYILYCSSFYLWNLVIYYLYSVMPRTLMLSLLWSYLIFVYFSCHVHTYVRTYVCNSPMFITRMFFCVRGRCGGNIYITRDKDKVCSCHIIYRPYSRVRSHHVCLLVSFLFTFYSFIYWYTKLVTRVLHGIR